MIYGHVLGGQLIHIYDSMFGRGGLFDTSPTPQHYLCSSSISEQDACRQFLTKEEPLNFYWRHAHCSPADQDARMDLAILRTSRQVYEETKLIPFQRNTFSFGSGAEFDQFVDMLLKEQQLALHSLQLVVPLTTYETCDRYQRHSIERLPGVQKLYLSVDMVFDPSHTEAYADMKDVDCQDLFLKFVLHARYLPLQEVYVEVSGGDVDEFEADTRSEADTWTILERRSWAGRIGRQLMGQVSVRYESPFLGTLDYRLAKRGDLFVVQ